MVLSGQGADEPHGGYGRHQAAAALGAAGIAGRAAGPLGSLAARVAGGNERVRRASRLLGDLEPADRLVRLLEITGDDLRTELTGTSGEEAAAERRARADAVLADVGDRGLVEQALYLDTHLHLPDSLLICADKMSMSASLEQRVPFLDVELMRFVERVPARERVRIRDGKRLHRKAMAQAGPAGGGRPAQARLLHPLRGLAAHLARRGGRAPVRARLPAGGPDRPRNRRSSGGGAPLQPIRPQEPPVLPARAVRLAPGVRAAARARPDVQLGATALTPEAPATETVPVNSSQGVTLRATQPHVSRRLAALLGDPEPVLAGPMWVDELYETLAAMTPSERDVVRALEPGGHEDSADNVLQRGRSPWLPALLDDGDLFMAYQPIVDLTLRRAPWPTRRWCAARWPTTRPWPGTRSWPPRAPTTASASWTSPAAAWRWSRPPARWRAASGCS